MNVARAVLLSTVGALALLGWVALPSGAAGDGIVQVTGVVWVDENMDGRQQPSEPVLPDLLVDVATNSRFFTQAKTNATGRYAIQLKAGAFYSLSVLYREPGFAPSASHLSLASHLGSADVYLRSDDTERTVNVRVRRLGPGVFSPPPEPLDWPVASGHFFKQAGRSPAGDVGYSVTDAEGIPFWEAWQSLDLEDVGYPVSHRLEWKGFTTQVFQKAAFQWQPGKGLFLLNVFDELHDAGLDPQLRATRFTPMQLDPSFDNGKSQEQIVQDRLALLDADPALQERYFAARDRLLLYGLPTSQVEDFGPVVAIRTQRTLLQHWKVDLPWAGVGDVTVANAGEIAREMGLFPRDPLIAQPPP